MPKTIAPLTDTQIKKAKFDEAKKVTKLFDGKGLYLLIDKANNKFWRFEYQRPYTKKSNTLSFGDYPTVTLFEARKKGMKLELYLNRIWILKPKNKESPTKLQMLISILLKSWVRSGTKNKDMLILQKKDMLEFSK